MPLTSDLQSKLAHLPAKPGVYLLKNARGEVLYIGKAAALLGYSPVVSFRKGIERFAEWLQSQMDREGREAWHQPRGLLCDANAPLD